MDTIIALAAGAATGSATAYAMWHAIAPRTRRVGGLWFARFGRFQLSWCICRRVPAKRIEFALS